jgi:RNA polymerase sigma factor for flagellar operon FliA
MKAKDKLVEQKENHKEVITKVKSRPNQDGFSLKRDLQLKTLTEAEKLKDKEESKRLWGKYTTKNKPAHIRDQLIKRYTYLVKWVIGRFPNIETSDFDRDDLLGYGCIGLIEAVDRYNPQQACSFETFAVNRIRGEILDFLRSRDFLSRTSRTRVKRYQAAYAKLESQLGRAPTKEEIMQALNISPEELRNVLNHANATIYSLDSAEATKPFEETRTSLVDNLAYEGPSQEDHADRVILKDKLAKAIDTLAPRDRLVVALYHYQKLTFKEIGEVLGVSESRASQLHMKILQKLKVIMKDFEH